MGVVAGPMSRAKIRRIANKIRALLKLDSLYFPIVPFIEWVLDDPDNEFGLQVEIVDPEAMPGVYAYTDTAKNIMKIREDCYIRAVQGVPRDRFTLCHELGHFLLHQAGNCQLARGDEGAVPKYRDPEWQANCFAAELMAPGDKIQGMSVEEICMQCGMSRQAAEIQYRAARS